LAFQEIILDRGDFGEVCGDGRDNDCNGSTDDGCEDIRECVPYYPQYDYNADGVLDSTDTTLLGAWVIELNGTPVEGFAETTYCPENFPAGTICDIDNSGVITQTDVNELFQIINGVDRDLGEICTDGFDNNCDGLTDTEDEYCIDLVDEVCTDPVTGIIIYHNETYSYGNAYTDPVLINGEVVGDASAVMIVVTPPGNTGELTIYTIPVDEYGYFEMWLPLNEDALDDNEAVGMLLWVKAIHTDPDCGMPYAIDFEIDFNGDEEECPTGTDPDGDGICDEVDNCPDVPNPDQTDTDGDGIGDECDENACPPEMDADGDGVCDTTDNCPDIANPDQLDSDNDGLGNVCDNCPQVYNPDQSDGDND